MPTLLINPSLIQRYTPNFKHLLRTNCHQKTAHFIEITQGICPYRAMGIVGSIFSKIWKRSLLLHFERLVQGVNYCRAKTCYLPILAVPARKKSAHQKLMEM